MIGDLQILQRQHYIEIKDAAIVIRKPDGKVMIKQARRLVTEGTLGGMFWGALVSTLVFDSVVGMGAGAVTGAVVGKFSDFGISDYFIKKVGATIMPNQSALFTLVESMALDEVVETLARRRATLLLTNMTHEEELRLREAFGLAEIDI